MHVLSLISTGMHPLPTLLSSGLTSAKVAMMIATREGRMSVSTLLTFVLAQHPDVENSNLGRGYYETEYPQLLCQGYGSAFVTMSLRRLQKKSHQESGIFVVYNAARSFVPTL